MAKPTESQYQILLAFRRALREYLRWSNQAAAELGLSSQQHQLLLAVRAHPGPVPPSISELADYLLIRHHSLVELANRAQAAGLVRREPDPDDQRVIRVVLTSAGSDLIERLSADHLAELQRVADHLGITEELLERLSRQFSHLVQETHGDGDVG